MKTYQSTSRFAKGMMRAAALTVAVALAACGGGSGAGGQGGSALSASSGSGTSSATSIQVLSSKASLLSDGSTTATITVMLKDSANNVVAKQGVTISSDDSNTLVTPAASPNVTGTSGTATATLQLMSGSTNATANRVINVTGVAGTLTQTIQIPVVGTAVTIAGPSTIAQGASGAYSLTLKDGGGNAISGVPVTIKSALGNAATPASVTTDGAGTASFSLLASAAGADTLSATALGATGSQAINVTSSTAEGMQFTPATNNVAVNQASGAIKLAYVKGGVPQAGQPVTLALTRGSFADCTISSSNACTTKSATTDSSGNVTITVISPTAGTSTLTGFLQSDPTVTANAAVQFFSGPTNATKITVSSSLSSVGINPPGSAGNNKSTIISVVRDATDNPIKGATVLFSANADPSGGSLSPASAVTDATGAASTTFTPGGSSTGPNAVVIQSSVATNASLTATTSLTVNQAAYFVDLGTGNQITGDATTYTMPWSAIVTDASEAAIAGQVVTPSMTAAYDGDSTNPTLKYYFKGVFAYNGSAWGTAGWTGSAASGQPTACLNEDANHNNILDAGEDKNGNGKLDPGSPAAVSVSGATDSTGYSTINVKYPKSFAYWVDVSLKATISTQGTQSFALRTFLLPGLSSDYGSANTAPPNVGAQIPGTNYYKGPFGADSTVDGNGYCTSPN